MSEIVGKSRARVSPNKPLIAALTEIKRIDEADRWIDFARATTHGLKLGDTVQVDGASLWQIVAVEAHRVKVKPAAREWSQADYLASLPDTPLFGVDVASADVWKARKIPDGGGQ